MEGAYNSEMYPNKPKGYRKTDQENYCKHDSKGEHQKPSTTAANLSGKSQSSAKPRQFC